MSLVVETGAGNPEAESYASVADADAYHSAFGNSGWTGEDSAKEVALRQAAAFIDYRFRGRWKGQRANETQRLAWPRKYVRDEDGYDLDEEAIPRAVVEATCEAALRALAGTDLMPDVERGDMASTETVGSISVTYESGAPVSAVFRRIDALLSGLAAGRGSIGSVRS